MYKFKMAIIEDNRYEQEMLREKLEEIVKGSNPVWYESGEAFLEANERYDIIFLDYEMSGMNGVEVAKLYRKTWPRTVIIFVSGHEEILPQGYRVRAHEFLVKPVSKERLEEVLAVISEECEYQSIVLEDAGVKYHVPVRSILYLESGKHGNGVVIRTKDRAFCSSLQLKDYENILSPECFVQSHRSYIVNLYHVKDYGKHLITISNGERARLSDRKRPFFEEKLTEFRWKKGTI